MITMKEIAALAGVSRGTVDRVINNRGSVNPETEQRVRSIIEALNYQPNKAALALAAQKKRILIGVVLFSANHGNPFFRDVLAGARHQEKKLAAYGCRILLRETAFDPQAQIEAISQLEAEGIRGLVISPCNDPNLAAKLNSLREAGIPVITTNTDLPNSGRLAYVGSNYYEGGCTAGGLMGMITGGAANVGIVTGSDLILCHSGRVQGFLDTVSRRFPAVRVLDIQKNDDDDFKSYEAVSRLMNRFPELNALYFTAGGVYGGCRAILEYKKDRAVQVISFDDVEKTKELVKSGVINATICQQPFRQGSRPVRLLFDYLTTGSAPSPAVQYTETAIKIRENIGP